MSNLHPTFRPGQRVRSSYGEEFTVLEQQGPNGCVILVQDRFGCRNHFHPSKLRVIERDRILAYPVLVYEERGSEWVTDGEPCDLGECFPDQDDQEYYAARAELDNNGEYIGGGGAAPTFKIVVARVVEDAPVSVSLLTEALDAQSLDEAIEPIMDALNLTTGDVAGQTVGEYESKWATMTREQRQRALSDWLRAEMLYA
jgi:hypothetical protein